MNWQNCVNQCLFHFRMKCQKQRRKIFKLAKSISGPFFTYKETNDSQYFSQGCDIKTLYNGIMMKNKRPRRVMRNTRGMVQCLAKILLSAGQRVKTSMLERSTLQLANLNNFVSLTL